jgi:potassium efflux system protein
VGEGSGAATTSGANANANANVSDMPGGDRPPAAAERDTKEVRAETAERLKRLAKGPDPDSTAAALASKGLREVLEERLHWLDEWDKAAKARHDAEHPEPSPDRQGAEMRADLERVKALLDQAARDPEALLPGVFRRQAGQMSEASRAEMKEALDAAKGELKDWKAKLEKLRADTATSSNSLSPLRVERDRIHQRVVALKSRNDEREAAVAAARTPEEAELARERLVNFSWESRVESERLLVQEALLTLEVTRNDLSALTLQDFEAHAQLAGRTLERMQERYRIVSDLQERNLKRAAVSEQKRAASADDPLEKYRGRRKAELLDLQAQVLKCENALATSQFPSLEDQQGLADRARADFAGVKHLLDDGRVSHLDALRLNNDFRRIGPERARIVSHELAAASAQLAYYENALSGVEIDLINDSRDDRLQHEDLLERLPKSRHPDAWAIFQDVEAQHLALLERKRLALEKLAARAEQTHEEIIRRLKTLDDQYGFIRTHIFWVRDQEPMGVATLAQCRREFALLGRSLFALMQEASDRSLWGRVSPEFAVASLALIGLPLPLRKLRKSLYPRRPKTQKTS